MKLILRGIEAIISLHGARLDPRPSDEERYPHVGLERVTLPFDQPELAQMVPVVGRVYYVRVVQLPQVLQFLVDLRARTWS